MPFRILKIKFPKGAWRKPLFYYSCPVSYEFTMAEGKFNIVQSFMILLYSYLSSLIVTSILPKLLISNIAYVILGLPILGFPTLPILTISLSLNFFNISIPCNLLNILGFHVIQY